MKTEMKTAIQLIAAKHDKNMKRFPPELENKYHEKGELASAAAFTLTGDVKYYPKSWSGWYLNKRLTEEDEIEILVNAAALICAEIERYQKLNNPEQ